MRRSYGRKRLQPIIRALVLVLALSCPASAVEERKGKSADIRDHAGNLVGLQLRISESKRKSDSVQYFRSIARQQRMRAIVIQSPVSSQRKKR